MDDSITVEDARTRDVVLPVTWGSWDYSDALVIDLYDVEFAADFGAFSKGEKIDCLSVDYETGTLSSYDDDKGEVAKVAHFKVVAIPALRAEGTLPPGASSLPPREMR